MTPEQIREGNKIIALFFCGGNPLCNFGSAHPEDNGMFFDEDTGKSYVHLSKRVNEKSIKFHKSWSWQIPVYSKLAKTLDTLAEYQKLQHMDSKYMQAMKDNDSLKAFEIIVENITWLNKNKNGK